MNSFSVVAFPALSSFLRIWQFGPVAGHFESILICMKYLLVLGKFYINLENIIFLIKVFNIIHIFSILYEGFDGLK